MQHSIKEQSSQQSAKKVWIKPEVEIIDTDYIQSGQRTGGPEGQRTTVFSANERYQS